MSSQGRSPRLSGDAIDVSRIEHENLIAEVVANRQRFERLEKQVAQLTAELDALKKLLHVRATP